MAVRMRLRRMGRKKRPYYRIVAADSRSPRDGRFLENLGTYDPLVKPYKIDIDEDRVFYWLNNGAQPSQTVTSLLRKKGIWLKWDLMKQGADEAKIAEEFAKWELAQTQKIERLLAKEQAKAEQKAKTAEAEVEEEADTAETEGETPEEPTTQE